MRHAAILLLILSTLARAESLQYTNGKYTIRGNWFVILPNLRLTAAHNVDDVVSIKVDGKNHNRVAIHFELDLAIMSDDTAVDPVKLSDKDPQPGDKVYVVGAYRKEPVVTENGKVVQTFWSGSVKTLVDMEIDSGLSGSPVFNSKDELVGIISCGIPEDGNKDGKMQKRKALIVPISAIRTFLEGAKLLK